MIRLQCPCGAEIHPIDMEELRMYQALEDCTFRGHPHGRHNFKIWRRDTDENSSR
jgi:hypothetical protein